MIKLVENLQNENLTEIGVRIGNHIITDEQVQQYCQEHFEKKLNVIISQYEAYEPVIDDTPYLIIHDISKHEGAYNKTPSYQCMVGVGICSAGEFVVTDKGVLVNDGQQRVSELLQLVQDSLNRYKGGCQPPTDVEALVAGVVGNNPLHWQAWLAATWQIEIPIGYKFDF
nr:MAG TPA: hypothetical protein [Caudoviricetes sp.]